MDAGLLARLGNGGGAPSDYHINVFLSEEDGGYIADSACDPDELAKERRGSVPDVERPGLEVRL